MKSILRALCIFILTHCYSVIASAQERNKGLYKELQKLGTSAQWIMADSIKLQFNAFHTQGMVKIGDVFYLSSVEIIQSTKRYDSSKNGIDRDAGKGVGHIFKIDKNGQLLKDIIVGEGDIYHPSGLDYDGEYIWFAVAEYRPNSKSKLYRLHVATNRVDELFTFNDHIGTLVKHSADSKLTLASWGAEKFYQVELNKDSKKTKSSQLVPNNFRYVAFQDSQYAGNNTLFGSGIRQYSHPNGNKFTLGGWELYDLKTMQPIWQLPITKVSPSSGVSLVNNPCHIALDNGTVKAYFAPDDNLKTVIYGYQILP